MSDSFSALRGKCIWWRESAVEEDLYDVRLREDQRRVYCSCFVEGRVWTHTRADVPANCPENLHCRYYIRHW